MMFIKRHFSNGGRASTIGARRVTERFSIPHIIGSKLFILCSEVSVLMSLVMSLKRVNISINFYISMKKETIFEITFI